LVVVLNAGTNKITATIPIIPTVGQLFNAGRSFAPSPDGKRLYLAGGNVSTIDTDKNTVVAENGDIAGANGIAISPDGRKAYVISGLGVIGVIDLLTNKVIAWITRPDAYKTNAGFWIFNQLAISLDGKRLYALDLFPPFSDVNKPAISVIDTGTNLVVANIPVDPPTYYTDLIVSPDGKTVFYNSGNTLTAIDVTSDHPTIRVPSSQIATSGIALSPDRKLLYFNTRSVPPAMHAIDANPKTGSPFVDTPLLSISIPPT
jgi:DNA-binding beta-propeller fold protein YncE